MAKHVEHSKARMSGYGWEVTDEPGRFEHIDKKLLLVDEKYQRDLLPSNMSKIRSIAAKWSWLACGVILVACRKGTYYVYDGQHRVVAALKRDDIKMMPCLVFDTDTAGQEAAAFLSANTMRKPLDGTAVHKASVAAGDPVALVVDRMISDSGRTVSGQTGPHTVKCVRNITCHVSRSPEVVKRVWPLVVELSRGIGLHERMVDTLMYMEERTIDGQSLADKEWRDRLRKVGGSALLDAATRFSAAYSKGGAKVWAAGFIDALNYRCKNILRISDVVTVD